MNTHLCPTDAEILALDIESQSSFAVTFRCACSRTFELSPPINFYGQLESAFSEKRKLTHDEAIKILGKTGRLRVIAPPKPVNHSRLISILDL